MNENLTPFEALQAAISVVGSQSAFARLCGVSQTAVWKWVQSSKRLPGDYVLQVEAATGVPRYQLRPDLYPINLPPAPARWYGIDRQIGARTRGLDGRSNGVSFNGPSKMKGVAL